MVTWPSGKARVCKTLIHQFKSGRHLQKSVDILSADFFVSVVSLRSQNLRPAIHHVRTFPVLEILGITERLQRLGNRREKFNPESAGNPNSLKPLQQKKRPAKPCRAFFLMILLYNTAPGPATADDIALPRRQPGSHGCRPGRWRHGQTPRFHHRICRRKAGG